MCRRAPYAPHDKTAPATKMTHPIDFLVCGVLCVTVAMWGNCNPRRNVASHENTKTWFDKLTTGACPERSRRVPSWLVHRPQRQRRHVFYEKPTARHGWRGPGRAV